MNDNQLGRLPESFGDLKILKCLGSHVWTAVDSEPRVLSLSNNQLQRLPQNFTQLTKVWRLGEGGLEFLVQNRPLLEAICIYLRGWIACGGFKSLPFIVDLPSGPVKKCCMGKTTSLSLPTPFASSLRVFDVRCLRLLWPSLTSQILGSHDLSPRGN